MSEPTGPNEFKILRLVAPGTSLREAIELVIRQSSGGLTVLGGGPKVDAISSGGFKLAGATFSPQRMAELSKMDGGVVLDSDAEHILAANVHLNPDPTIDTEETGTRHRTAERVARQTGVPVIAISDSKDLATVFTRSGKFELESPTSVLAQANQDVQSLERFRNRLDDAQDRLTRLEVDDIVLMRDVVQLLQRAGLVMSLGRDLDHFAVELGQEGGLIRLQITDLLDGVEELAGLVFRDYAKRPGRIKPLNRLAEAQSSDLFDANRVAAALDLGPLDAHVSPRGLRVLGRIPRLPESVQTSLMRRFGDFQTMLHASAAELDQVDGVGKARARQLRHYFDRLLEVTPHLDGDEE
ncbi:MAG: DNA integrity scanning diadenylate cyclase DisA [Acidimicrobiia bacterium]|nr:DNA integrity scanning diadenylate cyclase DisA [Acidimicrobiia bacterium]MDH3470531.1 DNA integrity scanning diadenylate cyclase DisA [Acidimicrobiia bacterium]